MKKYGKMLSKYIGRTNNWMCKASEVSKVIINKCLSRGFSLTAPKLQKLLVVMQGKCLSEHDKELFKEEVLAWSCGVAVKEVNSDFKNYDFKNSKGLQAYVVLLDYEDKIIDEVLDKFGDKDAITISADYRLSKLVKMFYEEGKSNIIPKNIIKDIFADDLY